MSGGLEEKTKYQAGDRDSSKPRTDQAGKPRVELGKPSAPECLRVPPAWSTHYRLVLRCGSWPSVPRKDLEIHQHFDTWTGLRREKEEVIK